MTLKGSHLFVCNFGYRKKFTKPFLFFVTYAIQEIISDDI